MELRKSLKSIFRGYTHFTPRMRSQLEKLGFRIKRQKSHFVLEYTKDGHELTFPVSCSGSDARAGLNLASDIARAISADTPVRKLPC